MLIYERNCSLGPFLKCFKADTLRRSDDDPYTIRLWSWWRQRGAAFASAPFRGPSPFLPLPCTHSLLWLPWIVVMVGGFGCPLFAGVCFSLLGTFDRQLAQTWPGAQAHYIRIIIELARFWVTWPRIKSLFLVLIENFVRSSCFGRGTIAPIFCFAWLSVDCAEPACTP